MDQRSVGKNAVEPFFQLNKHHFQLNKRSQIPKCLVHVVNAVLTVSHPHNGMIPWWTCSLMSGRKEIPNIIIGIAEADKNFGSLLPRGMYILFYIFFKKES